MARSLNKVTLIGNLTRDPELRYIPQGAAVCTFGLATNRQWTTDSGEKKESVEFHKIVAWNKLAELCSQLLAKGRKVFVEGRLQTRKWTGKDEVERTTTEIVIHDMIILDSRGSASAQAPSDFDIPEDLDASSPSEKDSPKPKTPPKAAAKAKKSVKKADKKKSTKKSNDDEEDEDIPF